MDTSDLIVEVRDRTLARVGQFSDSDLAGFTVVARSNDVGSWEATLPHTIFDVESGAEVIYDLSAALRSKGAGIIVSGPNGVILSGPMTEVKYEATAEENHGTWTFTGVSDTIVLQDALAYPDPTNSDATAQTLDNDERSGAAETVIKAYVSVNIGPTASTARKWTDLSIQTDSGVGSTVYGSARFDNLLALLQSLASVGGVNFDVVQVGNARQLRVWQPQDRSLLVRFDIDNGQLTTIDYGYGSPTSTRVIVGGPGDNVVDRTFVQRTTTDSTAEEALWNRRIEGFISDTSTDDTVVLSQEGDDALATDGVTVISTSITPSEDLSSTYMVDWSLGDTVTVVIGNAPALAPVTEAIIKADDNGLLVGATLGDPTGFDPDGIAYAKVTETADRVAAIERSGSQTPASPVVEWAAVADKPTYFPANLASVTATLGLANGGTGATSAASARTALGLGSIATLSSVDIINNTTGTLSVARGGTGATDAGTARSNLGITPANIGAQPAGSYQAAGNYVVDSDTDWINLAYISGFTQGTTPNRLQYRVVNGIFYLKGGATKSANFTSGSYTAVTATGAIPSQYLPANTGGSAGVTMRGGGAAANSCSSIWQIDTTGAIEVAYVLASGAAYGAWVETVMSWPVP